MLTTLRTFNPVVEVFDPYSTPFTNKIETKGRNSDNQQTNNSIAAMQCTACSACGGCACACSACSACG